MFIMRYYVHHALTTGAIPVSAKKRGNRNVAIGNFTTKDRRMYANITVKYIPPATYHQRKYEVIWMSMCSKH